MNTLKFISRFFMFAVSPMHAFDPKDPADVALLEEKVAAAVEQAVAPLAKKNKELLGEVKTLKKGAEVTPEQLQEVEAERDAALAQVKELDKASKAATKAAEDATKLLQGEQSFNQRLLVDNGLNAALLEVGVKNPAHLKAAAALIRSGAKIEVVADGENRVAKINDKPLADFAKEWAASDDGKAFVTAPLNTGGGSKGAGGFGGGAGKGAGDVKPNMGGTKAERVAALAAKFPELANDHGS